MRKFHFQLSVIAGAMSKMYGAATMVGKDERNGRINPALEPDDDLPAMEAQKQMQQMAINATSGGGGGQAGVPNVGPSGHAHTAF